MSALKRSAQQPEPLCSSRREWRACRTMSMDTADMLELDLVAPASHAAAAVTRTQAAPSRFVDYYELTKPRMNFLVLITTLVGFYMASGTRLDVRLLLPALIGTALTAAGASVLNQFTERELDALMPRTRNRPLPGGRIGAREALAFGIGLGILGVATLALLVNVLTAALGAFTLLAYVLIYTPLKRVTT